MLNYSAMAKLGIVSGMRVLGQKLTR